MLNIRIISQENNLVTSLNNIIKLVHTDIVCEMNPYRFIRNSLLFTFIPIIDTIRNY